MADCIWIIGTGCRMPCADMLAWESRLVTNYGNAAWDRTPVELWLAAHGKPVTDREVSPEQALTWLNGLSALMWPDPPPDPPPGEAPGEEPGETYAAAAPPAKLFGKAKKG